MKRRLYAVLIIFLLIIFSACEKESEQAVLYEEEEFSPSVLEYSHHNGAYVQSLKIISAYEGMAKYLELAQSADENTNFRLLYKDTVFNPIWENCFRDGEYVSLMNDYMFNTPIVSETLKQRIDKLSTMNIEITVLEALKKSSESLPGPDTTVCIFPHTEQALGFGINVGSGKITLFYHDTYWNTDVDVAGTVAHEYHHSVWTDKHYDYDYFNSFIEHLIFEGRAESFRLLLYPDAAPISLTTHQEEYGWNKIKDNLLSKDYTFINNAIYGGDGFPLYYGYVAGYHIVEDFIKNNPDVSIEEWTAMDPMELFERSNYEERFQ